MIVFWCVSKASLLNALSMPPIKPSAEASTKAQSASMITQ